MMIYRLGNKVRVVSEDNCSVLYKGGLGVRLMDEEAMPPHPCEVVLRPLPTLATKGDPLFRHGLWRSRPLPKRPKPLFPKRINGKGPLENVEMWPGRDGLHLMIYGEGEGRPGDWRYAA